LGEFEESPWGDQWLDPLGEPTKGSYRSLSSMLRRYKVKSTDVHDPADLDDEGKPKSCKGYRFKDFADPWKRYLPTPSVSARSARSARNEAQSQAVRADSADSAANEGVAANVENGHVPHLVPHLEKDLRERVGGGWDG